MFKLHQTCPSCPEQYDVYLGDEVIGYMRLRHGYFRAECRGVVVYEAQPDGDGSFESYERRRYLLGACGAIKRHMEAEGEPLYEIVHEVEKREEPR